MFLVIEQLGLATLPASRVSSFVDAASRLSVTVSLPFPATRPASTSSGTATSLVPSPAVGAIPCFLQVSFVVSTLPSNGASTWALSTPASLPVGSTTGQLSPRDVAIFVPYFFESMDIFSRLLLEMSRVTDGPLRSPFATVGAASLPSHVGFSTFAKGFTISVPTSFGGSTFPAGASSIPVLTVAPLPS